VHEPEMGQLSEEDSTWAKGGSPGLAGGDEYR
jgi:hypothetical protein